MSTEYITEEKRKELEKELEYLRGEKRREIIDSLEYAKSLGDLSENAEYHQAREDQAKLEDRISKIENILKTSTVLKKHKSSVIEIGSVAIVQKEGGKEQKTYHIVGAEEADMAKGKISYHSPLGQALLGKKKGDTVAVKTNLGIVNYKIIGVE
jgi:transcription elongation factor GreA